MEWLFSSCRVCEQGDKSQRRYNSKIEIENIKSERVYRKSRIINRTIRTQIALTRENYTRSGM